PPDPIIRPLRTLISPLGRTAVPNATPFPSDGIDSYLRAHPLVHVAGIVALCGWGVRGLVGAGPTARGYAGGTIYTPLRPQPEDAPPAIVDLAHVAGGMSVFG
ncbi:hypothetical protein, partial [Streptomyces sp. SP18CM02]|uniref:hypothetical protein n=1 Tax=Streptomyces sp. SP18CM02 TaxID=2758571 RepID=UPI00168A6114